MKDTFDSGGLWDFRAGVILFVAAFLFFTLFSPGFEPGESAKTIKAAAYFLHYGKLATEETERLVRTGELTIGPGKTVSLKYGGPILFSQFVGVMWVLEWLIRVFSLYPLGSPEFWYAVGFGLSFLPPVWSALTLLGVWLVLGTVGIPPRHRILACALLAVTSHQLPLTKTAYDGLFLGTVGIFAIWCGLHARERSSDAGGTVFVALAGLLCGLGVPTKESGILLGFPLGLLVLNSGAKARSKIWQALLLGGGLLLGLGVRLWWNLVMGLESWLVVYFVEGGINWVTGNYSLERLGVHLFSPALSVFVHAPTLLLLFIFAPRLRRLDPLLFAISTGTLLLSVGLHSAHLWEFAAAENYSGRHSVWVLPIAYLALGYLPRVFAAIGRVKKAVVLGLVGLGLVVSLASGLGSWPYRAAWLSRQHLGMVPAGQFEEVALANAWNPKYSLPLDAVVNLPKNLARIAGKIPPDLVKGASPINQGMSNGLATWWFALILMGYNRAAILLLVGAIAGTVVLLSAALWVRAKRSL